MLAENIAKRMGYNSSFVLLILILLSDDYTQHIMGLSPDFLQQMEDEKFDLSTFEEPIRYGDLDVINYVSDGKSLNATLWLHDPPIRNTELEDGVTELRYGVLLDADFSMVTGWNGADYEFYVKMERRNDESEAIWSAVFAEHTSEDKSRSISNPVNYTQYIEDGNKFVFLSLNLEKIGFPKDYRVISYASVQKDLVKRVDFTNWLDVPLTNFFVKTYPGKIEVRQGEDTNADIQIGSNTNSISNITGLQPLPDPSRIKLKFSNGTNHDFRLGIDPTPITIEATEDAPLGEHNIALLANISLSQPNFPSIFKGAQAPRTESSISAIINFNTTVLPPREPLDVLVSLVTPISNLLATLLAVVSGIAAGIYGIIRYRQGKVHKQEPGDAFD